MDAAFMFFIWISSAFTVLVWAFVAFMCVSLLKDEAQDHMMTRVRIDGNMSTKSTVVWISVASVFLAPLLGAAVGVILVIGAALILQNLLMATAIFITYLMIDSYVDQRRMAAL